MGTIISYVGGRFSLSKVYRTRVPFDGAKWIGQSGRMRWLANYNKVLTMGAQSAGFVFSQHVPLSVHAPPTARSMDRDQGAKEQRLGFRVTFTMGQLAISLRIRGRLAAKLRESAEIVGSSGRRKQQTESCEQSAMLSEHG